MSGLESSIGLHTLQSRGSEVIWKNIENDTLPIIVPRIFEEEGRTCRNIGSVDHKEVGGENGGQERTHPVEVARKGGIAGVSGAEGIADSYGGNITGQNVIECEMLRDEVAKNTVLTRQVGHVSLAKKLHIVSQVLPLTTFHM